LDIIVERPVDTLIRAFGRVRNIVLGRLSIREIFRIVIGRFLDTLMRIRDRAQRGWSEHGFAAVLMILERCCNDVAMNEDGSSSPFSRRSFVGRQRQGGKERHLSSCTFHLQLNRYPTLEETENILARSEQLELHARAPDGRA